VASLRITADHLALAAEALRFAKQELAPLGDRNEAARRLGPDTWQTLASFGALGLPFPEAYGGSGVDPLGCALVGEAFGRGGADGGLLLSWGAHSFLFGATVAEFCNDEQKARYVPRIASGELIGAFAITEPGAGSDAGGLRTSYRAVEDGFVLSGQKTYITNAPEAGLFLVFATKDANLKQMGISAFLVDRDTPGLTVGPHMEKLCTRASGTAEVFLEDCFVPDANLVGVEGMGFFVGLAALEWDRSQLLSPLIGAMEAILDEGVDYTLQREQFDRPLASFHGVRSMLADLAVYVTLGRWMVRRIAALKGEGGMHALEAAAAKCFTGGRCTAVSSRAVQIFGGAGLMDELKVERTFRDSKLASIGGGTTEVQHMILARLLPESRDSIALRPLPPAQAEGLDALVEELGTAWTLLAEAIALAGELKDAAGKPLLRAQWLRPHLADTFVSLDAINLGLEAAIVNEDDLPWMVLIGSRELRHGYHLLHSMITALLSGLEPGAPEAEAKTRALAAVVHEKMCAPPGEAALDNRIAEELIRRHG
jgi:alkylation response protein AidB-like acyl-CoA dehydrogenase